MNPLLNPRASGMRSETRFESFDFAANSLELCEIVVPSGRTREIFNWAALSESLISTNPDKNESVSESWEDSSRLSGETCNGIPARLSALSRITTPFMGRLSESTRIHPSTGEGTTEFASLDVSTDVKPFG